MRYVPAVSTLPQHPATGRENYFAEVLIWLAHQPTLRNELTALANAVTTQATAAYGAGTGRAYATVSGPLSVAVASGLVVAISTIVGGDFAAGQRLCLWHKAARAALWCELRAITWLGRGVVANFTVDVFATSGSGAELSGWVAFQIPRGDMDGALSRLFPIPPARAAAIVRDLTGAFATQLQPVWAFFSPTLIPPVDLQSSRASAATRRAASGGLVTVEADEPRIQFGRDGVCHGLLVEDARTNLVVQSQTVAERTVSLEPGVYALSVEGSDDATLEVYDDGAPMALLGVVTPAAWLPLSVATAKTVTLRPYGGVTAVQCEAGGYPTSHIPSGVTAAARAADAITVPLAGIDGFTPSQGTIFAAARTAPGCVSSQFLVQIDDGTANNRVIVYRGGNRKLVCAVVVAGTNQAVLDLGEVSDGMDFRMAFSWSAGTCAASLSGGAPVTAVAAAVPAALGTLRLGHPSGVSFRWGGEIRHLALFPRAMADTVRYLAWEA